MFWHCFVRSLEVLFQSGIFLTFPDGLHAFGSEKRIVSSPLYCLEIRLSPIKSDFFLFKRENVDIFKIQIF